MLEQQHGFTLKMPILNYYIRKAFRPKILVLDFDDTVCLWPRNLKLKNGKHLNFSAYMSNVFSKIVADILNIDIDEAYELCLTAFLEYGSSIIGLMESPDYDVSQKQIDEIFIRVHDQCANNPSKGLIAWAKPNDNLTSLLSNLITKPYIFTHGSTEYAKTGLACMGLLNTVIPEENVFGMDMYGYKNTKKTPASYIWLQQKINAPFNRMIMSEDSKHNLYWAKRLGLTTVLLHTPTEKGDPFPDISYVDHTHQTLENYLEVFLDKGVSYTEEKLNRSVFELISENQTLSADLQPFVK